ncbi:MAG: rhodanese-like domain-containing protein [Gammaproteobacteria bacterium]|nr:rhodanese-like domain-containing protein [Gammaproteobacteria bacterium]
MKLITSTFLLFFSVNAIADFTTLSTQQVQEKIAAGVAVIDIRRMDEYEQYGVIKGAHKLTFFDDKGNYNVQKWLKDLSAIVKTKDTPFILVCAHANRSKTVGKFLNKKKSYNNIFELKGGINYGWIDKGLPTTKMLANNGKPWYQFW